MKEYCTFCNRFTEDYVMHKGRKKKCICYICIIEAESVMKAKQLAKSQLGMELE